MVREFELGMATIRSGETGPAPPASPAAPAATAKASERARPAIRRRFAGEV